MAYAQQTPLSSEWTKRLRCLRGVFFLSIRPIDAVLHAWDVHEPPRISLAPLYARLYLVELDSNIYPFGMAISFKTVDSKPSHAIRASISRSYMSCASKIASLGSCARFMSEQSSRDKSSLANSNTSSEGMIRVQFESQGI